MPKILHRFAVAIAATFSFSLPATAQQTAAEQLADLPRNGSWGTEITEVRDGHLIGNPDAEAKLIEFMSYTCSHCATFTKQGEGAIKLVYVPTGKVSFEIRHLLRDPIDLTAALLTQCGDPRNFPLNHSAIMYRQEKWMEVGQKTTQAQRARWQFGTPAARRRAIANDLGFYEIMKSRGYDRVELDRCLADEQKATSLAETSRADVEQYGLTGTPSFVLNGELLDGVHQWSALQPELDRFFASPSLSREPEPAEE